MHQLRHLPATFRPFAIDLPGHGESSGPACESAQELSDVIEAVVSTLAIDRPVLVGHSLGGVAAIEYAAFHSECVRGIVLISTALKFGTAPETVLEWKENPESFKAHKQRSDAVMVAGDKRMLAALARYRALLPMETQIADHYVLARWDGTEQFRQIQGPVLLVTGEHDMLKPAMESMRAELISACLIVLPRSGHLPVIEDPEALTQTIGSFLSGVR